MPRPRLKPYDWQLPAVLAQSAILQRKSVLNASDTGTGKTVMACASLAGTRPLVIAPKVTLPAWKRTLAAMGVTPLAVVTWEKVQHGLPGLLRIRYQTQHSFELTVPSPEPVLKWTFSRGVTCGAEWKIHGNKAVFVHADKKSKPVAPYPPAFAVLVDKRIVPATYGEIKSTRSILELTWTLPEDAVIVWDEVHKAGNASSLNCKIHVAASMRGIRSLNLSGTVADDPTQMKAVGVALGLFPPSDYYRWMFQHGCKKGHFGGVQFFPYPKNPEDHPEEVAVIKEKRAYHLRSIHERIFPQQGVRLRRADIPNFPGTVILPEIYELDDMQKVAELTDRIAWLEAKTAQDQADEKPEITLLLREREYLETMKLPILLELAEEAIENGRSPLIFVTFRHSITWLASKLSKHKVSVIMGGQGDREEQVQHFLHNRTRVAVCQIASGGVGVDLDDITGLWPRESIICPDQSAKNLRQALGRPQRARSKSDSIQRIVYLAGTYEEKICRVVKTKLDNLDLLNDGDIRNTILEHLK